MKGSARTIRAVLAARLDRIVSQRSVVALVLLGMFLVAIPARGDIPSLNPPSATVAIGSESVVKSVTVEVSVSEESSSCLSGGGLPDGVTIEFVPECGVGSFTSTMTVTVDANTAPGLYDIETIQSCGPEGISASGVEGLETPGSSCSGKTVWPLTVVRLIGGPPPTPSESLSPPAPTGPTEVTGAAGGPAPGEPPPSSVEEFVDKVLDRLTDPGRILYNPPSRMSVGERELVEVRITLDPSVNLGSGLAGSGVPIEGIVRVAPKMIVDLVGPDFDITPLSPKRQVVGGTDFNEWAFHIAPQRAGTTFLWLTVSVDVKGEQLRGVSPVVLRRKIQVDVDPVHELITFIGDNWQPVLGVGLAMATLLFGSGVLVSRRQLARGSATRPRRRRRSRPHRARHEPT